jgi:WD40 repeat-containing protein SMU1
LIQQFLKENGLMESFKTLERETGVTISHCPMNLSRNIDAGRWEAVIESMVGVEIDLKHLVDLYEHMVIEYCEEHKHATARTILRESEPLQYLRDTDSERYLRLESMLTQIVFDQSVYKGDKIKRRLEIAEQLRNRFDCAEPGRLLQVLGDAMKWQVSQAKLDPEMHYNIFLGKPQDLELEKDTVISTLLHTISFPRKEHPVSCAFSPNGQSFALGAFDGFIEIRDVLTGKIRKDLPYQPEKMMLLRSTCLSLAFSNCSKMLASGCKNGDLTVWKISTGTELKVFQGAHSQGITCVVFNDDGSQILTGSFDHTVRIHGMNSGRTLKILRGHTSFVNSVVFSNDYRQIISGSSDGSVKIWDFTTTECHWTLNLHEGELVTRGVNVPSVHTIIPLINGHYLVSTQSRFIYVISSNGRVIFIDPVDSMLDGRKKGICLY